MEHGTTVLVIGGYGGFGQVIAEELACVGFLVLVAGRSFERADAFCRRHDGMVPIQCDRADIAQVLTDYSPSIVVDASGPFQAMDYVVPKACIVARIPYIDIADSTAFVCNIAQLDADAKAAGVPIISGASSVPALSGAAVRALAHGMTHVDAVDIAITASNRASAGPAVVEAVLSQVGQPFSLYGHGQEQRVFGWQDAQSLTFAIAGAAPIRRSAYLVDVPDVRLLPGRLPGNPTVTFRAGTELAFQNGALWLLSWLVRWRLIKSLRPFARWLLPLQRLTKRWGGVRSAMMVRVAGIVDGRAVRRDWMLIAEKGDGPRIPALSVAPLVQCIIAGSVPPGARDAGSELTLAHYQPAFDRLAVHHSIVEV